MKMNKFNPVLFGLLTLILAISTINAQDDKQYQELAIRLVQSASVKPGDAVIIEGGKHMIPLMEAVAIEVQKAGGMPNMILSSDRVTRSFYTEVPEQYLEQEPRYLAEWYKHTDVYISLPTIENRKALNAGVPETRFAKMAKAAEFMGKMVDSFPFRAVSINFPTEQNAANSGVDFPTYQKMIMDAINTDYQAISAKGSNLKQMIQNAKQIRVTNPAGTDFTFSPAVGRKILLDDGIVTAEEAKSKSYLDRVASLPGGSISFAPLETSANGKVVVAKARCKSMPMNNISFEFKNGQMQNFKAPTNGNCFQETMQPYTGPKDMFGVVTCGLNPALRVMEEGNANYRPSSAAGMVNIAIGNNRVFGGNNNTNGSYGFNITNATVTIDGQTVIKDGKLVM